MKYCTSKWIPLLLVLCISFNEVRANTDSTKATKPTIKWEAYGDFFWTYDNGFSEGEKRQSFLYNHNRHGKVDLNLGYFKVGINHEKYRANVSVQTGTYVNDNYATDHAILRHFQEANAGFSLNKKRTIWLDAGIFQSHIGFESAVSADNMNLSRSLLAENSPYYMAGAKLSYEPNASWKMSASLLNGWQRIQYVAGNSLPAIGTQVTYTTESDFLFNWSTFIGTVDPDSTRRMRYFQNFYGQWKFGKKLKVIGGFDLGLQQTAINSSSYHHWFSPVAIAQYQMNSKLKTAARIERFADINNAHIAPINGKGFDCNGYSINLDFAPNPNILLRVETRYLKSTQALFEKNGNWQNSNFTMLANLIFKIGS